MQTKVYLAGPMRGIPEFNYPAFKRAAEKLRAQDYFVFSPAERDIERHDGVDIAAGNATGSIDEAVAKHGFSLREALADDTQFICIHANAIALLPGWEKSKGVAAELALSRALGHTEIYLDDNGEISKLKEAS